MNGRAKLDITEQDGVTIVVFDGELDVYNAYEMEPDVIAAVMRPNPAMIIDLSTVSYIDSAGMGVLIRLAERAPTLDPPRDLRLVVPAESPIRTTLTLVGLPELVNFNLDREAALQALAA